jgi:uncharacterized protein YggE
MKPLIYLALLGLPITLLADGGLPAQPYIYVEGTAEIEKPADMVILRFDLAAWNADQAKANQEVQAKASRILELLNEKKVAQNDVIAADLKSERQYETGGEEDSPRKRGKLVGYKVTRTFSAKLRDVTAVAKLVDELLAIGGVEFSGVESGLTNEKELTGQMWEKALGNAKEQAEQTLKPAGMKIDSIFAISPVAFPLIHQKIFGRGGDMAEYGPMASASAGVRSPSQYRLAPIAVTQTVHVIYLISSGAK